MDPPQAPTEKPATRSRMKRRLRWLLGVLAGVALVVAGFYSWENRKGRKALEAAVAAWETDGYSLKPETLLPPAVPAAENFCTTPLLDGIATDYDSEDREPSRKRSFLVKLIPKNPAFDQSLPPKWKPQEAVRETTGGLGRLSKVFAPEYYHDAAI